VKPFCADNDAPTNAQYDQFISSKYLAYKRDQQKENRPADEFKAWVLWRFRGYFSSDPIVPQGRVQHAHRKSAREFCWSKGKRLPTIEEALFLMKSSILAYISAPRVMGNDFDWMTDSLEEVKYRVGRQASSNNITLNSKDGDDGSLSSSFFCVTRPK